MSAAVRLGFDRRDHVEEAADIRRRDAPRDRTFETRQVIVDLPGDPPAFGRRRDDERPSIGRAHVPGDEPAVHEAIENAGQRRSLVREAAVEILDRRRRGGGELREDVRLALRQPELPKVSQIQADSMRRAVDVWDQT